jgi:RNA polymerase sigma-70 factor (ECF subfamily)
VEGRPHDESTLARLAKEGDVDAYAALVRSHQPAALRLAYVICGGSGDAEDATQEAFVKAYYALDRFDPSAPFRNWVLRIVANEAKNRRRAAGRRQRYELAVDPASGGTALSPEAAVITSEARQSLADAVARLPARLRDVVACRYLLDLSEAETSAVLGVPAGTAKSRLSRGIERLRREGLGGEEVGDG